ncbi:hypothetical protein POX_a00728 [Penicillium oxalicum]|uniref:hypothetical protein n=1 Tax=Penicillium oxalicum TaxID=69781 RepID=UPI0020B7A5D3|nr:hypothetical protein POX_a00728 [Penicillium oxalicum]KAI2794138.1 hypothetical protein POX_a00728 [Penicillium oxalicum]
MNKREGHVCSAIPSQVSPSGEIGLHPEVPRGVAPNNPVPQDKGKARTAASEQIGLASRFGPVLRQVMTVLIGNRTREVRASKFGKDYDCEEAQEYGQRPVQCKVGGIEVTGSRDVGPSVLWVGQDEALAQQILVRRGWLGPTWQPRILQIQNHLSRLLVIRAETGSSLVRVRSGDRGRCTHNGEFRMCEKLPALSGIFALRGPGDHFKAAQSIG